MNEPVEIGSKPETSSFKKLVLLKKLSFIDTKPN